MKSTHRAAARAKRHMVTTYGLLDTLFARPDAPMPEQRRTFQLSRMYQGLHALETAAAPTPDDWRVVSDAVNLMETLVKDMQLCEDTAGLLADYASVLETLSERTMTECHRRTERRIAEIHTGKARAHDVRVMAI